MIGRAIALYCQGVRDARHGVKRARHLHESDMNRRNYLLGHDDERGRMERTRRLAQMEMPLEAPDADGP